MALQIDKTLDSGVLLKYHRVSRIRIDFSQDLADIEIASYLDEEARRDGKRPVMTSMYTIVGEIVRSGDARQIAYAAVTAEGQEYEGAIAV